MNLDPTSTAPEAEDAAASLWLRLQSRDAEARAGCAEARRLARELALGRRLLKFAETGRPAAPASIAPVAEEGPVRATLLTERVIYHLDACENRGTHTAMAGWAFRPAVGWDARETVVTLKFRHGGSIHQAVARSVLRRDVAAFYAGQPADLAGGATGLEGAGFVCEVWHASLPAGVDLEIWLRLECGSLACEQPTGTLLRF